jgi:hypothetical protein
VTTKAQVDLATYKKAPRLLESKMEEALAPGGGLAPLLVAAKADPSLRFEIRERRFSIYYRGGSLLRVDGRRSPWTMRIDNHYFLRRASETPDLPATYLSVVDTEKWVEAFPELKRAMDQWWQENPREERDYCQKIAQDNSGNATASTLDYLIFDLEYQWAQRRFDMVAARRWPTETDPSGWREPGLVFVEVKSDVSACRGGSGLVAHTQDYADLVGATMSGAADASVSALIKMEYEALIGQKRRLGLIDASWPFRRFSDNSPGLLIVLVGLDPESLELCELLAEVGIVARKLGTRGAIHLMQLDPPDYAMTNDCMFPLPSAAKCGDQIA